MYLNFFKLCQLCGHLFSYDKKNSNHTIGLNCKGLLGIAVNGFLENIFKKIYADINLVFCLACGNVDKPERNRFSRSSLSGF